jgi:hypothetical protein
MLIALAMLHVVSMEWTEIDGVRYAVAALTGIETLVKGCNTLKFTSLEIELK